MTVSMRLIIDHPSPPAGLREFAESLRLIASGNTSREEKASAAVEAASLCVMDLSQDEAKATRRVLTKLSLHLYPSCNAFRNAIREVERAHEGITIEMDDLVVALKVTAKDGNANTDQFLNAMAQLWRDTIELTMGTPDDDLKLWLREDHQTVIEAIRCYYSLIVHVSHKYPRSRSTLSGAIGFRSTNETLNSFVNVALPLWRRLLRYQDSSEDLGFTEGVNMQRAERQQAALWRYLLDHLDGEVPVLFNEPKFTTMHGSSSYRTGPESIHHEEIHGQLSAIPDCAPKAASAPMLQVVQGPIPSAHNREDKDLLKQYEPLAKSPLPVATMPNVKDIEHVISKLRSEYPWAERTADEISRLLKLRSYFGCNELVLPPMLLVGPPGTGKSRFARRLAQLLSLPFQSIALGGSHDVKLLMGTSRGWGSCTPSPLITRMLQSRSASLLVLLDEIDKCAVYNSDSKPLTNAMLGLLEPETAAHFRDSCLQSRCDLSRIIYVATANSLTMDKALLSRFTVLHVPEPREQDRPSLANAMLGDMAEEMGLPRGVMPEVPAEVMRLINGNARSMRQFLRRYLSEWAEETLSKDRLH